MNEFYNANRAANDLDLWLGFLERDMRKWDDVEDFFAREAWRDLDELLTKIGQWHKKLQQHTKQEGDEQ